MPRSFYLILFVIFTAGNISVYRSVFAPDILRVSVLEVGKKGSAVLVRSPGGATILINTGPDASILRALGNEFPPWQRRIDAVLLTSATIGSAGGLPEVMSRYRVSNLVRFGMKGSKSLEATLAETVSAETELRQINTLPDARITLNDGVNILTSSPNEFEILYGSTLLKVSSTTPKGVYTSDGETINKN